MRVALLGFWHVHAADYAREALAHPGVDLVCGWDSDLQRGTAECARHGIPFEANLESVLSDRSLDGVIVTTATADHPAVISAALAHGKHVFAEKVLAGTLQEALSLRAAAIAADLVLTVCLFRAGLPAIKEMRRLIAAGEIGDVTAVKVRVGHDGRLPTTDQPRGWLPDRFMDPAEAQGGALIDLGAHPLYLNRLLLGPIERVSAMLGHWGGEATEDNASVTIATARGAIGSAETSFVEGSRSFVVAARGTKGALMWSGSRDGGRLRLSRLPGSGESQVWDDASLPPGDPTPFERWVDLVCTGASADPELPLAIELSALVEASYRSATEGHVVRLDELTGWEDV